MKPFFKIFPFFAIFFTLAGKAQYPIINEVEYSNIHILKDKDGDSPDWFELYNPGKKAINLNGFLVTDDTTETSYWTFPDYELGPDSFLVVFASGKNITEGHEFHTDFKLRLMKDNLFLLDPSGNVIDKIAKSCAPTDYSIGRVQDGSSELQVIVPTPGRSNNGTAVISLNYQKDTLLVNYQGGLYKESISLEFTNRNKANKIMYTLNGNVPNEFSEIYESPIVLEDISNHENRFANKVESADNPGNQIFKANIVRVIVYSDGCPASEELSNTYFINSTIESRYTVPIVSLITDENNLFDKQTGIYVKGENINYFQGGKDWERPVHIQVFDTGGQRIVDQDAGIRIHGGGSRGRDQKSFRLYARNKYNDPYFNCPFFDQKPGLSQFKTLMLHSATDWSQSLFLDELGHHLVQNMDIDYAACQTVVTFINGEYWGIYSLRERQDKYYIQNNYGLEACNPDIIGYKIKNISIEEGSIDSYNDLVDFISSADPKSDEFYQGISERMDIDALIDYYIAELYFANTDFPHNNQELWKTDSDTSKWRFFLFDLDAIMFRENYNLLSEYNNLIPENQLFPEFSTYIFRNLLNNELFRQKFTSRFYNQLSTTFSTDTVLRQIEAFEKIYAPLIAEHTYRWHTPVNYLKWEENVRVIKEFALQRSLEMAEQLSDNFGNPFIIYPNPASDLLHLQFSGYLEPVIISVFDINGLLKVRWKAQKLENNEFSEGINLIPGIYVLTVQSGTMLYTDKLVIE